MSSVTAHKIECGPVCPAPGGHEPAVGPGSAAPSRGPKALVIGNLTIDPPLVLAPMAGVTDSPYRAVMAGHGIGMATTEMVSAEGLRRKQPASWRLCAQTPELPVPLAVQIFGSDPVAVSEAARMVEQGGAPLIDINAGCPARKIVRQGSGACLLKDPDHLAFLVEQTRKAVSVPLTVKIRLGWDADSICVVETVKRLESAGVDAVTIHARTAAQQYAGSADWEWIRRAKASARIPVIGNGDVCSPSSADRMLLETECDAVMIGRSSMGNPWLFSAIAERWSRSPSLCGGGAGTVAAESGAAESGAGGWEVFHETVGAHLQAFMRCKPQCIGHLRMIMVWYSRGCPDAAKLRSSLMRVNRVDDMLSLFRKWLDENAAGSPDFLPFKLGETGTSASLRRRDGCEGGPEGVGPAACRADGRGASEFVRTSVNADDGGDVRQ